MKIIIMEAKKILFITQEMVPYVPESYMSVMGRHLPQSVQEQGREIRTFMPKWGNINERRNQLHEVIRLSGMNLIIDDTDHPLIIKVASIQAARLQVYFIDNDDYFMKRLMAEDENSQEYDDNSERAIFYARGVLETVKKLRWVPDVIHCHGWISALAPLYIKKAYQDEPSFRDTKVVFSLYDDELKKPMGTNFGNCLLFKGVDKSVLEGFSPECTFEELNKLAVDYSDGVIAASPHANANIIQYAQERQVPVLEYPGEDYTDAYLDFYDRIWSIGKEE
jgi:hypothetical protein